MSWFSSLSTWYSARPTAFSILQDPVMDLHQSAWVCLRRGCLSSLITLSHPGLHPVQPGVHRFLVEPFDFIVGVDAAGIRGTAGSASQACHHRARLSGLAGGRSSVQSHCPVSSRTRPDAVFRCRRADRQLFKALADHFAQQPFIDPVLAGICRPRGSLSSTTCPSALVRAEINSTRPVEYIVIQLFWSLDWSGPYTSSSAARGSLQPARAESGLPQYAGASYSAIGSASGGQIRGIRRLPGSGEYFFVPPGPAACCPASHRSRLAGWRSGNAASRR